MPPVMPEYMASDGHSLPLRAGLFILSWPCTPCPCQEKHPQATPSFVHPCLISSVVPSGEFCTIWIGFTCCMATISTTRIPQLIVDRNAVLYSRCPMNDMAATSGPRHRQTVMPLTSHPACSKGLRSPLALLSLRQASNQVRDSYRINNWSSWGTYNCARDCAEFKRCQVKPGHALRNADRQLIVSWSARRRVRAEEGYFRGSGTATFIANEHSHGPNVHHTPLTCIQSCVCRKSCSRYSIMSSFGRDSFVHIQKIMFGHSSADLHFSGTLPP